MVSMSLPLGRKCHRGETNEPAHSPRYRLRPRYPPPYCLEATKASRPSSARNLSLQNKIWPSGKPGTRDRKCDSICVTKNFYKNKCRAFILYVSMKERLVFALDLDLLGLEWCLSSLNCLISVLNFFSRTNTWKIQASHKRSLQLFDIWTEIN